MLGVEDGQVLMQNDLQSSQHAAAVTLLSHAFMSLTHLEVRARRVRAEGFCEGTDLRRTQAGQQAMQRSASLTHGLQVRLASVVTHGVGYDYAEEGKFATPVQKGVAKPWGDKMGLAIAFFKIETSVGARSRAHGMRVRDAITAT